MEYYQTKGDLLEAQGKDRADVRWVDRQMAKGVIEHNENGFYFVMDYLRSRIAELEKGGEKNSPKESSPQNGDLEKIKKELEEAQINSEYWEKQTRRYGKLINSVIGICYKKIKALLGSKFAQSEDSFREGILEEVKLMEEAS